MASLTSHTVKGQGSHRRPGEARLLGDWTRQRALVGLHDASRLGRGGGGKEVSFPHSLTF